MGGKKKVLFNVIAKENLKAKSQCKLETQKLGFSSFIQLGNTAVQFRLVIAHP